MLRYTLAAAFVFFAIATVYYFSREATHVALRKPLGRTNESSTYWLVVDHGNREAFRQSISPTEDPLVYQCPIREGDILPVAMFRDATLQHHPYYNPFGDNLLDSGSGWTLEVRGRPSWRAGHAVWNQNPAFRILTTALFFAATLIAYNPRARAIRLPNLCMLLVCVSMGFLWAIAGDLRISMSVATAFAAFTFLSCCGRDSMAIGTGVGGLFLFAMSLGTGTESCATSEYATLLGCVIGAIASLMFKREATPGGITNR